MGCSSTRGGRPCARPELAGRLPLRVVPQTPQGVCRLRGALRDADERAEQPVTVWWWDDDSGQERRGTLYGWRRGGDGERQALIVTRSMWDACPVGGDCVRWVPEHLTRERSE